MADSNTTVNNAEIDQGGHLEAREACMEMPKSKKMHDHQQQDSGTKLHKNNKEVFPTENKTMMSTKKLPMNNKLSKKNTLQLHHERMGHISCDGLHLMAEKGIMPRKFSD